MKRVLFDGQVQVDYNQIYITSGYDLPTPGAGRAGQVNGLCGAAEPGFLFLVTGLHLGDVPITVELHDEEPIVDEAWEEVVEVSFQPTGRPVRLTQWAGESWPLDVGLVSMRARYCASGMDEAREADNRRADEPELDRYLLQLWRAPPSGDRVIKQTSSIAGYWHGVARAEPPPPTPAERLEVERREAESRRQGQAEHRKRRRQEEVDRWWGGVSPSERLGAIGGAAALAHLDRPLLDALDAAEEGVQRDVARWAARRAYDEAGLSAIEGVRPALDALDRGEELPPPFDDRSRVWTALFGVMEIHNVHSSIGGIEPPTFPFPVPGRMMPEAAALPALFAAIDADPLSAAIGALYPAVVVYGSDHQRLFRELRAAFPTLA